VTNTGLPALTLLLLGTLPSLALADGPDEWVHSSEEGLHLEITHSVGLGTMWTGENPYFAATGEFALVDYFESSAAREDADDALALGLVLGDVLGVAGRVTAFTNGADGGASWATAVGIGPVMLNRLAGTSLRVPSILGVLIPEIGAAFRPHAPTAVYVAWELPFAIRFDRRLSLDAALRIYAIDDWLSPRVEHPGVEPWEIMTTVSLGIRLVE